MAAEAEEGVVVVGCNTGKQLLEEHNVLHKPTKVMFLGVTMSLTNTVLVFNVFDNSRL